MSSPILEVNSVSKSFGNIKALDNVDFYLQKGVVHGLLGENGAGKSSLMNVLSGIYLPESGTIKIKNQNIHKMNPDIASSFGVGMAVSYTHLRAHETASYLVCRLLLEK